MICVPFYNLFISLFVSNSVNAVWQISKLKPLFWEENNPHGLVTTSAERIDLNGGGAAVTPTFDVRVGSPNGLEGVRGSHGSRGNTSGVSVW